MTATAELNSPATETPLESAWDPPRLVRLASWSIAGVGLAAVVWYLWVVTTVGIPVVVAYRGAGVIVATTALVLTYTAVALILTVRRPEHRVGWAFAGASVLLATHAAAAAYLFYARHRGLPPVAPGAELAAWLSTVASVPAFANFVILIMLIFPTGHLRSRRWSLVGLAGLIGVVGLSLYFTWRPGRMIFYPGIINPFGIGELAPSELLNVLYIASVVVLCGAAAGAAYCMYDRYHDANPVERQQLKWVAYAAAIATLAAGLFFTKINFTLPQNSTEELTLVATLVAVCLLPIAAAVACLKYRLYDIDLIINRTVAWVILTAILGGLYAALLTLFQRIFVAVTGDRSDAAIIVTTLVLAGLFSPLKKTLEGAVDRRFKTVTTPQSASGGSASLVVTPEIEALVARVSESVSERVTERVARRVVAEELARLREPANPLQTEPDGALPDRA